MSGRGVVVCGMHRSGTSAVARVVNLLGIPLLAGDLLPADDANPRGYWESEALRRFDDDLLEALGGSWSLPPAAPDWSRANGLRERARQTFGASLDGEWVWKDPRASVTLPWWRATFGLEPAVVLSHRDPREVATSLARRDGFPAARSFALWERYVRASLAAAAGLPTFVVGYAELLEDPEGTAGRLADWLRGRGFSVAGARPGEVAAFVDSGLHRSQPAEDSPSPEQQALWARIRGLEGEHEAFDPGELGAETPGAAYLLVAEEIAGLRARVRTLEAARHDLLGSRSYRWTAPARSLLRLLDRP